MVIRKVGQYVGWPPPEEFRALIDRAQHGDAGALERLLSALRQPLLAYFARRVPADAAEDLAQIALLRIARAVPRIQPDQAGQYVSAVARNLFRSAHRQRVRDHERYTTGGLVESAESPAALELDVEYQELAEAIARVSHKVLPAPLRQIVLGLLNGDTPAEIAARQHVSPVTIRTRLLRARACLRRELRVYLDRDRCAPSEKTASGGERDVEPEHFRKCRGI